jgi:hypothetical protein
VEQRVKVMDTLDKKMQTILEREDWSADERLKLYDQSFTRYLNVHDDYTPTPVAFAPKPVIENEMLESAIKAMKTKAQLLLKKMKSSPDMQGKNRSRKQRGGFSQKEILQQTRMGNIRRSLARSKCSTRFGWSRGPVDIHRSDEKNTEISQTTTESLPY